MPKDIAVVSYNENPNSHLTKDAIAIRDALNGNGYSAQLVHQWALNECNPQFKNQNDWERFDGVVVCKFYSYWTLRELIRSGRPVVCANAAYVDDFGLGATMQEHMSEDEFDVVDAAHSITTGAGVTAGGIDIGDAVWVDSVETSNHHVDVLIESLAGRAVLVAHKAHPLAYFGWYRMSQASAGSKLFELLVQTANWTFSGP